MEPPSGVGASDVGASGVGLVGLGDEKYPIQFNLFRHFASQKNFIRGGAREWRSHHSNVHACDVIDPQAKIFRQCSSFCVETFLAEHHIERSLFDQSLALLYMVNRGMKDLYGSIRKGIGSNTRRPLLFVRMLDIDSGECEFRGWLLTRAMFKPREINAVAMYPVNVGSPLQTPLDMQMDLQLVQNSEFRMPEFLCLDGLGAEMASLKHLFPDRRFQYCFNPTYILPAVLPLTHVRVVGPLNFIEPGPLQYDPSDDEGAEEEEIDEIDEMLSDLLSFGTKPPQKKPAKTSKPKKPTATAGVFCQKHVFSRVFDFLVVFSIVSSR